MITLSSIVAVSPNQVSCDLAGEAAILNLKTGVYYGLDPVGARIWDLLGRPRRLAEVRDLILDEYDVEPERCELDLVKLVEKMAAEGLVEVRDEAAG